MSSFGILAVSPSPFELRDSLALFAKGEYLPSDGAIAVAAALAGEAGIIDLEYASLGEPENRQSLADTFAIVREKGAARYGIRCGVGQIAQLKVLLKETAVSRAGSADLIAILAADGDEAELKKAIQSVQSAGWLAYVESVSIESALAAEAAGADGIIAKGHECGGRVGEQTAYVLLQECVRRVKLPIFVQGGIGLHSAAACQVAGAAGIVLSSQLLLARESTLPNAMKQKIATMDGTETSLVPLADGRYFRFYSRHDHAAHLEHKSLAEEKKCGLDFLLAFIEANRLSDRIWLLGQDVCFAEKLARKFVSVAGILQGIRQSIAEHLEEASASLSLQEASPLAVSHETRYPVVQGAMTRVSDCAQFALDVAKGGALPFLALALMRKPEAEAVVSKTHELLEKRPWGVGLLGFVPNELRQEQLEVILKYKPPFALIAGGRPDQAKSLEDIGIKTYLHVPSPLLLESFIEMGSRRFIFEGKECGGHVGPRSSFILWETMIEVLLRLVGSDANRYHLLFAGGIHDELSAAMVATMTAPLAVRGVKIGVLMGTAYLFTEEAVSSGAIVKTFQNAALKCRQTVLLETGPGHAIRCIDSPYRRDFNEKRQELVLLHKTRDEIREELELMNLGRLRIASKGLARPASAGSTKEQAIADLKNEGNSAPAGVASNLHSVGEDEQWHDGMYMIGQVASMHDQTTTIDRLHENVCAGSTALLKSWVKPNVSVVGEADNLFSVTKPPSEPVAIVGMSCYFPQATDLETYWTNILQKVDTITEVPLEQWDWREFYDANPLARDKIYSKWGGFLPDITFDPTLYGIPPSSLNSIDPMQVLLLEITRSALEDAGYTHRSFPKQKTSVILANAGHGPITAFYSLRSMLGWKLADLSEEVKEHIKSKLPEWSEDSFPGYLGNVTAGRVANRYDLGGVNFSVDAACGSSLAALYVAMADLRTRNSDVVFLCASDTHNQPGDYLSFSKTHAFSQHGRCRTFDATADGIVISEGMGMLVLKRLADAEKDGDRIYAVIKGVGGSSDGRDLSLTAPRPAGQVLALRRAYEDAGISAATVSLIEAHGTGTVAGDKAEIEALKQVFEASGARIRACAVGSVKTMIGHTKASAGVASLIKVAKALHHKVLPPTMGVTVPNPSCNFESSPFYINSESRPWLNIQRGLDGKPVPRRAGVSAFGFGGTNFHTVLEEYVPAIKVEDEEPAQKAWPGELFVLQAASRVDLFKSIGWLSDQIKRALAAVGTPDKSVANGVAGSGGAAHSPSLTELAYQLHLRNHDTQTKQSALLKQVPLASATGAPETPLGSVLPAAKREQSTTESGNQAVLSIVASSFADLQDKLSRAKSDLLDATKKQIKDPRGVYFNDSPASHARERKVAFVFPGQGSQQVDMLKELACTFAEVRNTFESAASVLSAELEKPLTEYIFPPPSFTEDEKKEQQRALTDTRIAQPAVGAADLSALHLLKALNVAPDMVAGHSYGEYVALCAAGVMSEADLLKISEIRGRILSQRKSGPAGSMAAVTSGSHAIQKILDKLSGVTLANINAPNQCVISGEQTLIDSAVSFCKENGLAAKVIPVSQAFHSSHMKHAKEPLAEALTKIALDKPSIPVYSNSDGDVYPSQPEEIAKKLSEHIVSPVDFVNEIRRMYNDGARIFVEVGPGAVLSGLVSSILNDQATPVALAHGEGLKARTAGQADRAAGTDIPEVSDSGQSALPASTQDFLSISIDRPGKGGLNQLLQALAQLAAWGVPLNCALLFRGRIGAKELMPLVASAASTTKRKLLYRVNSCKMERIGQEIKSASQAVPAGAANAGPTGNGAVATAKDMTSQSVHASLGKPTENNVPMPNVPASSTSVTGRGGNGDLSAIKQIGGGKGKSSQNGDSNVPFEPNTSHVTASPAGGNGNGNVHHPAPAPVAGINQQALKGQNGGLEMMTHFPSQQPTAPGVPFGSMPDPVAFLPHQLMPQSQQATYGGQPVANSWSGTDQLIMHYQQVLLQMSNNLLISQQQVMLTYLQARAAAMNPARQPMWNTVQPGPAQYALPSNAMQQYAPNPFPPGAINPFPQVSSAPLHPHAVQPAVAPGFVPQAAPFVHSAPSNYAMPATAGTAAVPAQPHSQSPSAAPTSSHQQTTVGNVSDEPGAVYHASGALAVEHDPSGRGEIGEISGVAAAEASAETEYDAEHLVAALLDIVSQRTGYPPDMLDPTLDLEADLGIDSIKRVEILNSFRKILPGSKQAQLESGIEELAGTKTLEGIIAWIRKEPGSAQGTAGGVLDKTEQAAAGPTDAKPSQPHNLNVKIDGTALDFAVDGKLGAGGENGNGHGNGNGNGKHGASDQETSQETGKESTVAAEASKKKSSTILSEMKRALIKIVELPELRNESKLSGVWIVSARAKSAANLGLADEVCGRFANAGAVPIVIGHQESSSGSESECSAVVNVDLTDLDAVNAVVRSIKTKYGPISGLVHCLAADESGMAGGLGVKSLFVLAKALESDITRQSLSTAGVIVFTKLGGAFRSARHFELDPNSASQAGAVGLLKSLGKEWVGVNCKALDFDPRASDREMAAAALLEIGQRDGRVEIGHATDLRRLGLDVVYAPLSPETSVPEGAAQLGSESVILVTGGARGITAEIAAELAQRYRPVLILAGRAEKPESAESSETLGLTTPKDLKAAIMEKLRQEQKPLSIALVEQIYQKLLRDREIRDNVQRLTGLGARVVYRSVDVKNEESFSRLIRDIYDQFGRIDGVVHGAGVIEDGFVKQKSLESFSRVFDTKVKSANILAETLDFNTLKFMFLFSSVVGRTGNAGQTDYVAANEVVNKLAVELNSKHEARIASIMWGPWRGGMANPELESIFARYGWAMIAPEDGRKAFFEELAKGDKANDEVLLVAELIKDATAPTGEGARLHGLCAQKSIEDGNAIGYEFHLNLNLAEDLYLRDHTFDGVPVMPMAFALELMTEAVQSIYKDHAVICVHSLDIPSGMVFDTATKPIALSVEEKSRSEHGVFAEAALSLSFPRKRTNFKATFELKSPLALAQAKGRHQASDGEKRHLIPAHVPVRASLEELNRLSDIEADMITVEEIYQSYLFHGPMFQHIASIEAIGSDGIVGSVRPSSPKTCLVSGSQKHWAIDPVLLDSAMQIAGVWVRKALDITTLPTGFKKLHLFDSLHEERYYVRAFMDQSITASNLCCHVGVFSAVDGRLVLLLESLGGVGSKSLNRLAASASTPRDER